VVLEHERRGHLGNLGTNRQPVEHDVAQVLGVCDSDMQQDGLGRALDAAESNRLARGDLIFWNGHAAIARDADTIVHCNAHHMATAIENTRGVIARIKAAGSEVMAIKRLA